MSKRQVITISLAAAALTRLPSWRYGLASSAQRRILDAISSRNMLRTSFRTLPSPPFVMIAIPRPCGFRQTPSPQVRVDRVIEVDPTRLDQRHHRPSRERLRYRSEVKHRLSPHRRGRFAIGNAVGTSGRLTTVKECDSNSRFPVLLQKGRDH